MSHHRTLATLLSALALGACNGGPGEPPNLPAPEYEAPRSYDPDKAIDSMAGAEEGTIVDAPPPPPPPAPPAATAPLPEGAGGSAGDGDAAGGATAVDPES